MTHSSSVRRTRRLRSTSLTSPSAALSVHATAGQALIGISDGDVSWTDCGVYGRVSGTRAAAVVASNSSGGTALYVNGKVNLIKRSGRIDVPAGADHVDVDLRAKGGLGGSSLCFANLMSFREGMFVAAMRPNYPQLRPRPDPPQSSRAGHDAGRLAGAQLGEARPCRWGPR